MGILNIDLVVFAVLIFVYTKLKSAKPDTLFLAKDVGVFLPPEEKDIQELRKEQQKVQKKGGKKPLMPVKLMKAKQEIFSKYAFSVELDVAVMLLVCLVLQLIISEFVKKVILTPEQNEKDLSLTLALGMVVVLLVLAYYCKSVKIGGWKSTDTKLSLLISLISSLLVLTLFFGFKDSVDLDFKTSVEKQKTHLDYVLKPVFAQDSDGSTSEGFSKTDKAFISVEQLQIACVFLNGIAIFSCVPTIIRFSHCYARNLLKTAEINKREQNKREQLEEEEEQSKQKAEAATKPADKNTTSNKNSKNSRKNENTAPQESNVFSEIAKQDREENLEIGVEKQTNLTISDHKRNMLFFNISLVLNLLSIALWIAPVVSLLTSQLGKDITETYLQPVRLLLVVLQSIFLLLTMKYQLGMFASKGFEYLKQLSEDSNQDTYQVVRYKTSAYVQSVMHVAFQIFAFAIIPLMLALLIAYRQYLSTTNPLPADLTGAAEVPTPSFTDPNGEFDQEKYIAVKVATFKALYGNFRVYSLFDGLFIQTTLSFWLFNYQLVTYILKIIFVIINRQSLGI